MYGLIVLALAYIISHFYRSFLAVLSPLLEADLGMTPAQMSDALGAWFAAFALSQFLVGVLLDKIGPKWTTAGLFTVCAGGGGVLFGAAGSVFHIYVAMVLMGIGCAPVLMASVYIFKRSFDSRKFAFLTSVFIAVGLFGNILGTAPLAWALESFGWQTVMYGLSALTFVLALLIIVLVNDPPPVAVSGEKRGGYLEILKLSGIWLILPLIFFNYAVSAGIRGLWVGPYLSQIMNMDASGIGHITLWMAIAMAAGSFAFGPADQLFNSRKKVVLSGGWVVLAVLWFWVIRMPESETVITAMVVVSGFCGMYFGVLMAHATANIPDHLAGRGVTLINFFNMGGVGVMQWVTAGVYRQSEQSGDPSHAFQMVILTYAIALSAAFALYVSSKDVKPKA